jgi:SAM-dependent methyltransferase
MENSKIHFLSDPAFFQEKEKIYLEVRRREGRIFPDEVVRALPFVSKSNPYAKEWVWRRRSFERFLSCCKHLSALRGENVEWTDSDRMTKNGVVGEDANNGKFCILDLGCGNGWLANRLAENPDWEVWAADVNEEELAQGARLFGRENLQFVYVDTLSDVLPQRFDLAVLAASVQYFPDLEQLIFFLKKHLKPGSEIHILDSPFYKNEKEQAAARRRTLEYYTKLGVPEMAAFYHHHLWADVEKLGGVNLNNRLEIKFLQKIKWLAPFPWVKM